MTKKHLFITEPADFWTIVKHYNGNAAKTNKRVTIHKRHPAISILRFAAHALVSVALLPLFLINGSDNVKLNKIEHDDSVDDQQLIPRF